MTGSRTRPAVLIAGLLLGLLAAALQGVQGKELENVPSEDQCRPYIEKALKDLGTEGSDEQSSVEDVEAAGDNNDEEPKEESAGDSNDYDDKSGSREKRDVSATDDDDTGVDDGNEDDDQSEVNENEVGEDQEETVETQSAEEDNDQEEHGEDSQGKQDNEENTGVVDEYGEDKSNSGEDTVVEEGSAENKDENSDQKDSTEIDNNDNKDNSVSSKQKTGEAEDVSTNEEEKEKSIEDEVDADSKQQNESLETEAEENSKENEKSEESKESVEEDKKSIEEDKKSIEEDKKSIEEEEIVPEQAASIEQEPEFTEAKEEEKQSNEGDNSKEKEESKEEEIEKSKESEDENDGGSTEKSSDQVEGENKNLIEEGEDSRPEEEELIMEIEIPEILRPRDHINQLLKLDEENEDNEKAIGQVSDIVLRDLKRLYDTAIKPLETLYKYRDLSNRHFGDPEIFSKPLVLFMGPWSGGKSSIINYLLDIEYKPTSLRTGAEPSPAYFNILMHGEEEEVLDGTQLAADWTFSGLQKFGQGLLDRLKGLKLNNKLLEKVNIVEIPGILEIRKQVQRLFPFNDACQWFIDRADIIFLVYDPSKLDVGPETEAILDQLKGREYQTRIILNKADQVKPEELMRVQGALIWNISPLMSSAEPPIMYSTSLWSIPYEAGAPTRLLYAQERAFLRDLRSAIDKRVEHKIASARRFAVRVRNHAKMVDCYLTTYYNHKSFFAKKKDISDSIIGNPQDYHIYEGLSTLTNISRYDLPDPDVYRDFFRLNALYDFPLLSSTCTYFRGCPINRLDVSIAYDLPELVGKYKKSVEATRHQEEAPAAPTSPTPTEQAKEEKKPNARSGASRISMS